MVPLWARVAALAALPGPGALTYSGFVAVVARASAGAPRLRGAPRGGAASLIAAGATEATGVRHVRIARDFLRFVVAAAVQPGQMRDLIGDPDTLATYLVFRVTAEKCDPTWPSYPYRSDPHHAIKPSTAHTHLHLIPIALRELGLPSPALSARDAKRMKAALSHLAPLARVEHHPPLTLHLLHDLTSWLRQHGGPPGLDAAGMAELAIFCMLRAHELTTVTVGDCHVLITAPGEPPAVKLAFRDKTHLDDNRQCLMLPTKFPTAMKWLLARIRPPHAVEAPLLTPEALAALRRGIAWLHGAYPRMRTRTLHAFRPGGVGAFLRWRMPVTFVVKQAGWSGTAGTRIESYIQPGSSDYALTFHAYLDASTTKGR